MKIRRVALILVLLCAVMGISAWRSHPSVSARVDDFLKILPGDSCEMARARYGKEATRDQYALTWKNSTVQTSMQVNQRCVANSVLYQVASGHQLLTPDGIILGQDTLASAVRKLKPLMTTSSPFISEGEGQISAEIELAPAPALPFKRLYVVSYPANTTNFTPTRA